MMTPISLAFSSCPNDTFIFHAMLHRLVDTGDFDFQPHMDDVEALNLLAFQKKFAVTKLSFFAYLKLSGAYEMLDAGSALGFGCGPLLIAPSDDIDLTKARVAIPGEYTTAHLLLRLWNPGIGHTEATRFDGIMPGVKNGTYDAGVIIHEGRFVFKEYGLKKIIDLGEWWEQTHQAPIPLGCIAILKEEPIISYKSEIETIIRNSIRYGFQNKGASRAYIKKFAQEMEDQVIENHIRLYVNDFSVSLGEAGKKAVETLNEAAKCAKII